MAKEVEVVGGDGAWAIVRVVRRIVDFGAVGGGVTGDQRVGEGQGADAIVIHAAATVGRPNCPRGCCCVMVRVP